MDTYWKIYENDAPPSVNCGCSYNGWYWGEVSDTIEHIFKKLGGNPIPNILTRDILRIDEDDTNFRI